MTQEEREEWTNKIVKGLDLVYERLIEYKKAKNSKLVVVREGKIVWLTPEQAQKQVDENTN